MASIEHKITPEAMSKTDHYRWQVNATDNRITAWVYTAMSDLKRRKQVAEVRNARAPQVEEIALREARILAQEPQFCADLQRWISECVDERLQGAVAQYWRSLGARI